MSLQERVMKKVLSVLVTASLLCNVNYTFANSETEAIKQQLADLKRNYEQRIKALEARLNDNGK